MRIAHVVSTFPPYRGGMGNVAAEIAKRTAARGHEVAVVTPQNLHPWLRFGNAAWCPGIERELERVRPDVVHFHWPFIGGLAPVLRWRRRDPRRRLIVQYHMNLLAPGWRGVVFAAYERRAVPMMACAADRVVVSSLDYAQQGALAPYAEEFSGRIVEIPLGVDTLRFSPSRREGELEGVGEFIALFVGGLDHAHAFKGLPVLLEAIARVPSARLRVVGDGDLRPAYERQVRALGISDRVEFLGAVSNAELPTVHRNADVLVLPSTARSEAFGLVLLEAMASGIATIASNLPGVRTVIADGETGFLVSPGDAQALASRLSELARDPERTCRLGAAGRRRAEATYAWDGIIERWSRCYETVVCADG